MTAHPPGSASWLVPLFAAMGLTLGRGYFTALRRGVAAYTAAQPVRSLAWLLARLAAAALFFALTARWGTWALLAAFAGFLVARQLAVRAARGTT
jgi:hypothetical protein